LPPLTRPCFLDGSVGGAVAEGATHRPRIHTKSYRPFRPQVDGRVFAISRIELETEGQVSRDRRCHIRTGLLRQPRWIVPSSKAPRGCGSQSGWRSFSRSPALRAVGRSQYWAIESRGYLPLFSGYTHFCQRSVVPPLACGRLNWRIIMMSSRSVVSHRSGANRDRPPFDGKPERKYQRPETRRPSRSRPPFATRRASSRTRFGTAVHGVTSFKPAPR